MPSTMSTGNIGLNHFDDGPPSRELLEAGADQFLVTTQQIQFVEDDQVGGDELR